MNLRSIKILLVTLLVVCCGVFLNTNLNKAYAGVCQAENCNKTSNVSTGSSCGDGVCSASLGETMTSCVADCGMPAVTCGDNVCSYDSGENCNSCARDCGACATPTRTPTPTPSHCGDGVCSSSLGETMTSCPVDCGMPAVRCGDGVCSYNSGESCSTCPNDCMCMTTTTVRPTTTTIRQTTTTVRPTTTTTTVPACAAPKHYVQGVCCAASEKYLVNGKCSACPSGQHMVSGVCCSASQNYVVDGKCSSCGSFKINTVWHGKGRRNAAGAGWVITNSDAPTCLKQMIQTSQRNCFANGYTTSNYLYDSCMYLEFSGYNVATQWYQFWSKPTSDYRPLYYTVDAAGKCKLSNSQVGAACNAAELHWYTTPISLLLNTGYEEFQNESRVVNFALGPNGRDFSVWKGSERAPLLVFDPEHKGEITSAEQLFGNWTFGGKKQASLASTTKTSSAWANGYEALGSMDTNNDGVVSGDELSSLALWFDENRNAKSEAGEVKPVTEVGIKTLYYKEYSKDAISEDLISSVGFEREVSGKLVKGISVDWYGYTAKSEAELVQKQVSKAALCSKEISSAANINMPKSKEVVETSQFSSSRVETNFYGTWAWKVNSDKIDSSGVLIFADDQKGAIAGMTLTELMLDPSKQQDVQEDSGKSVVMPINLKTELVKDPSGDYLKFSYQLEDGSSVESQATISADGSRLTGRSVASVQNAGNREIKAEYNWTAFRYQE